MTTRTGIVLFASFLLLRSAACRSFDSSSPDESSGGLPSDAEGASSGAGGEIAGAGMGSGGDSGNAGAGGEVGGEASLNGSGGEAGAPSSLLPSDVAGLALWLEATDALCTRGTTEEVSRCADQSKNGNDAVQPESLLQPTFIPEAPNGHATLRFDDDPSTLLVADHESLNFGEGDFSYLAVARWRNDEQPSPDYAGYGVLLAKQYKWHPYEGLALYANFPSPGGVGDLQAMRRFAGQLEVVETVALSYSNHLNDDVFRVYVARRVGGDLELYINGALEGRSIITGQLDVDALGEPLTLGGYPSQPLRGDISELVVIGGALNDGELQALQRGLMSKYDL